MRTAITAIESGEKFAIGASDRARVIKRDADVNPLVIAHKDAITRRAAANLLDVVDPVSPTAAPHAPHVHFIWALCPAFIIEGDADVDILAGCIVTLDLAAFGLFKKKDFVAGTATAEAFDAVFRIPVKGSVTTRPVRAVKRD